MTTAKELKSELGVKLPQYVSEIEYNKSKIKMTIRFHPHALDRMKERGATEEEVENTVEQGEQFPAKFGRIGFRRNFLFDSEWRGKHYKIKQVEAYAVKEDSEWLVITVITHYF